MSASHLSDSAVTLPSVRWVYTMLRSVSIGVNSRSISPQALLVGANSVNWPPLFPERKPERSTRATSSQNLLKLFMEQMYSLMDLAPTSPQVFGTSSSSSDRWGASVCSQVGTGVSVNGWSMGAGVNLVLLGAWDGSCSQVGVPVSLAVGDAVGFFVGGTVGYSVGGFVVVGGGAIGAGVNLSSVCSHVGVTVGSLEVVGAGVGLGAVGSGVGLPVGAGVGFAVGPGVGFDVGNGVGFAVGVGVGFAVGEGVSNVVGENVGLVVVVGKSGLGAGVKGPGF
mmetsp:Transcript_7357/g.18467  ORF Transcript_7357/g.18467 Transcript_7357/m.18467 type:complete len:280 (-) Transcript_7357:1356-2195(-)